MAQKQYASLSNSSNDTKYGLCSCCLGLFTQENDNSITGTHSNSTQPMTEQPQNFELQKQQMLLQQQQLINQQQQILIQQQNLISQQNVQAPQKSQVTNQINSSGEQDAIQSVEQFTTDDPITELSEKLGRLQFSIVYDFKSSTLTLKIIRATNLEAKDIGGTSDPYVKVILLPDKKTKLTTKPKHKNCNPRWNETFSYEDYPYEKIKDAVLFLQVLDYDRFSKDDPIGEIEIPMSEFDLAHGQTLWKNLRPSEGKTTGRLGELSLILYYDNPTIKITVVKASNLKAKDINGKSDPYVKIWLLIDNKKQEKKKTTIKECCLNPIYNESFTFNVPLEKIRQASFLISVMDYDKFGRNEPIGQIILGSKSSPDQVKHWNEMFKKPRQDILQWHILKAFE